VVEDPQTGAEASPGEGPGSSDRAGATSGGPDAGAPDRTYAIPFERVWGAMLALVAELPRWTVLRADDQVGVIRVEASTRLFRRIDDVTIRIGLDADAQTRVDVEMERRSGKSDPRGDARRTDRLLNRLDQRLQATPAQILSR
jgi:hypothetical protein